MLQAIRESEITVGPVTTTSADCTGGMAGVVYESRSAFRWCRDGVSISHEWRRSSSPWRGQAKTWKHRRRRRPIMARERLRSFSRSGPLLFTNRCRRLQPASRFVTGRVKLRSCEAWWFGIGSLGGRPLFVRWSRRVRRRWRTGARAVQYSSRTESPSRSGTRRRRLGSPRSRAVTYQRFL